MINPKNIKKRKNQKVDDKGAITTRIGRAPKPYKIVGWHLNFPKKIKEKTLAYLSKEECDYDSASSLITHLLRNFLDKH